MTACARHVCFTPESGHLSPCAAGKIYEYTPLGGFRRVSGRLVKYLVTIALIVAFATPALAADYDVALRLGDGGGCVIMDHKPGPKKYKIMGAFSSRSMAKKAMSEMSQCQ